MVKRALKTRDRQYMQYKHVGLVHAMVGDRSLCETANPDTAKLVLNKDVTCFFCFRKLVPIEEMSNWLLKPLEVDAFGRSREVHTHLMIPSRIKLRTLCASGYQRKRWAGTFLSRNQEQVTCKTCLRRSEETKML